MSLRLAKCYVSVRIDKSQFDTGLSEVMGSLGKLSNFGAIPLKIDIGAATASINLLQQQVDALKASIASVKMPGGSAGGTVGGTGGSRSGRSAGPDVVYVNTSGATSSSPSPMVTSTGLARLNAGGSGGGPSGPVIVPQGMIRGGGGQLMLSAPGTGLARSSGGGLAGIPTARVIATTLGGGGRSGGQFMLEDANGSGDRNRGRAKVRIIADDLAMAGGGGGGRGGRRGWNWGGGGGGGGGGFVGRNAGSFASGAAQGLGLGYVADPAMLAGRALGAAVTGAVSGAVGMETNMATLQRVSGLTAADMQKFQKTIFDIATTVPGNSPQDVLDIAGAGARAGVADRGGAAGLEEFTRSMASIRGAVQGIGTEQLADQLGRVVGLYGEGTDKIEGYGSALTYLDNVSKSTASDILSVTVGLAATTNNLKGLPVEKVMAIASGLKDAGISNQLGVSSMGQVLRSMGSKPEKYADALGMPKEEFSAIYDRDAYEALSLVSAKFKEMAAISPTAGQEWLVSLGLEGQKVGLVFQALTTVLDDVTARAKAAKEQTQSLDALTSAKEITGKTTGTATGKAAAAAQELGVTVGGLITPAIKEGADAAVPFLRGVTDMIKAPREMVRDPSTGKMVRRDSLVVDPNTGKVRQRNESDTSWGGLRVTPPATAKEVGDANFLRDSNAKAAWESSPAGRRAKQLSLVEAERKAAQERSDAKMAEHTRLNNIAEGGGETWDQGGNVPDRFFAAGPLKPKTWNAGAFDEDMWKAPKETKGQREWRMNNLSDSTNFDSSLNQASHSGDSSKNEEQLGEQKKTNELLGRLVAKADRPATGGVILRGMA